MKKIIQVGIPLLFASLCVSAFSAQFKEPVSTDAVVTSQPFKNGLGAAAQGEKTKEVYLMGLNLSDEQKQKLNKSGIPKVKLSGIPNPISLPASIDLGMSNVPVLDQGHHGTCVTFAVSAAVDALLSKGDYISQLCNLELGDYLSKAGFYPSGWDGSWGVIVLNQMTEFGIINKTNQQKNSCAGLTNYPAKEGAGKSMSLDEFKTMHEDLNTQLEWQPILSVAQRMGDDPIYKFDGEKVLNEVKASLASSAANKNNVRIAFGTFLPAAQCHARACARFHKASDTWAFTKAIQNTPETWYDAGHEMVIVGYDDKAIAIDNEGAKHQGLLTLRNSWGSDVGDGGNFYMSYDYFKRMVIEVSEIIRSPARE